MKKLLRLGATLLLASLLGGCVLLHGYAPPVQQGNVLSILQANRVHPGLTKQAVKNILGSPVYTNTFSTKWVYIYSHEVYSKPIHTKKMIITFRNGRVSQIEKAVNMLPSRDKMLLP